MTTLSQKDQHNRRDNQQYRMQMQGKYQMRHIAQLLFSEKQLQQKGENRNQQQQDNGQIIPEIDHIF